MVLNNFKFLITVSSNVKRISDDGLRKKKTYKKRFHKRLALRDMLLYYFASAVKSIQFHVDDDIIDKLNYYYTTSIITGVFLNIFFPSVQIPFNFYEGKLVINVQ